MEHELDHRNLDHGFAVFDEFLIVFAQPTSMAEPGEGAFHDPAFGKNLKTNLLTKFLNDLEAPTTPPQQPVHKLPGVTAIRPNQLDGRK